MKMKIGAAHKSAHALRTLSQIALPGATAYMVAKLLRKFTPIAESVDAAQESALKRHGDPVKDRPGTYGLKDPTAFNAEMEEVLSKEEEIDVDLGWAKIAPAVLMEVKIPGSVFIDLDWLIRE